MGKAVSLEELKTIADSLHAQGKRIVTTNGIFDLLHLGHIRMLETAKQFGDILVVGINSDSSTKKLKGNLRPVIPQEQRAEMLAAIYCVDYVAIFEETDPSKFCEIVKPNFHVKSEYEVEKMPETPIVRKYGGEVKIVDFPRQARTTDIFKKIQEIIKVEQNGAK